MATTNNIFLFVILTAVVSGCAAGFKATHDHDPEQDFSAYQSYAWISEHPMKVGVTNRIPNPLLEPRIMSAVDAALAAKGYSLVREAATADFALSFTVGSREEIKVDSYPSMTTRNPQVPLEAGVGRGRRESRLWSRQRKEARRNNRQWKSKLRTSRRHSACVLRPRIISSSTSPYHRDLIHAIHLS